MAITCADCGNDQARQDSPHQGKTAAEGGVGKAPRPLCDPCYDIAFRAEYGDDTPQQGPDAPARPNPGDVPAGG